MNSAVSLGLTLSVRLLEIPVPLNRRRLGHVGGGELEGGRLRIWGSRGFLRETLRDVKAVMEHYRENRGKMARIGM